MSGMLSCGRMTDARINHQYLMGCNNVNETNDCADAVLESPDRFLLSQEQLFEAEGGWSTFATTVGLGLVGVAGIIAMNGGIGVHLSRGNLKFREWL